MTPVVYMPKNSDDDGQDIRQWAFSPVLGRRVTRSTLKNRFITTNYQRARGKAQRGVLFTLRRCK